MLKKKFLLNRTTTLLVCFLILISLALGFSWLFRSNDTDRSLIQDMIEMGDWYARNQKKQGDFIYLVDTSNGEVISGANNIVRQAGSLYGLAQLFDFSKDPKIEKTILKGFRYFVSITMAQNDQTLAVEYQQKRKTNASALLLLAYLEYLQTKPEMMDQYGPTARKLADFIVSQQTSAGGYYYQQHTESDYNNGECLDAVVRAYLLFHDEKYLVSAKKAALYFEQYYGSRAFSGTFYSWGMAGFAHLYRISPEEHYWSFMHQTTDKYFQDRGDDYVKYINEGVGEPPIPRLSVFLEGLAHVGWIAKTKDPIYFERIKNVYYDSLIFLRRYHLVDTPDVKLNDRLRGAVCAETACETVRLDISHHNISAIYLYFTLLKN